MINEVSYINIREVLSRLMRNPLLQEVTLEQVIQYTLDFIGIFGMPRLYQDKEELIIIENYRGILPCDIVSINQVKEYDSNLCLRSMTDTFKSNDSLEATYKTQGNIIYTSFKEGKIIVSYKTIAVDKDGLPLLINNSNFLKTLELYIKKEVYTILFDMSKIQQNVLQNTQQQYAWTAGQLQSEFTIPSVSEMESIKRSWCTLLHRTTSFNNGFKDNSNQEYIRKH